MIEVSSCRKCDRIPRGYCQEHRKERQRAYDKRQRLKRKAEVSLVVNKIKNNPCADCGQTFHPCAMDFDHVRGEKKFNISSYSEKRKAIATLIKEILEEIEKCELVCSNCHRVRTFNRRQS